MGRELRRLQRRRKTGDELDKILDRPADALVVHYSCENFYDRDDGRTPRVTSVAVRNFDSGQTESYSIHKVAEQRGLPFEQIPEHYDELEKVMLEEFFGFVQKNQGLLWIHWNMRDINYVIVQKQVKRLIKSVHWRRSGSSTVREHHRDG